MAFKVIVDVDACQGYACCVMAAPAVFDLDEETGKVVLLIEEPDPSLRSDVETAVRGCPVQAIIIQEDT